MSAPPLEPASPPEPVRAAVPPPPPPTLPPRPDLTSGIRPLATWRAWSVVLIYGLVWVLVGSVIYGILQAIIPNQGEVELLASVLSDIALVTALVIFLRARHPEWIRTIGWPARDRRLREVAAGASRGLLLFVIANFGVALLLTVLISALIGHQPATPRQLPEHLTVTGSILAVLFAVIVAPITEEFFFRGCVFRSLRDHYGFWIGALGSALLFGFVHIPLNGSFFQPQTLLLQGVMLCTGFGFAFIYERRGNLMASIAAHMAFNIIGIVLIFWAR